MATVRVDMAILLYENDQEFLQILDVGEPIDISTLTASEQANLEAFFRIFGQDNHFVNVYNVPINEDIYCIRMGNFDLDCKLNINLSKHTKIDSDYDLLDSVDKNIVDEFCLFIKMLAESNNKEE